MKDFKKWTVLSVYLLSEAEKDLILKSDPILSATYFQKWPHSFCYICLWWILEACKDANFFGRLPLILNAQASKNIHIWKASLQHGKQWDTHYCYIYKIPQFCVARIIQAPDICAVMFVAWLGVIIVTILKWSCFPHYGVSAASKGSPCLKIHSGHRFAVLWQFIEKTKVISDSKRGRSSRLLCKSLIKASPLTKEFSHADGLLITGREQKMSSRY